VSVNVNWLYLTANLCMTAGFTGFYTVWNQAGRSESWAAFFVALTLNSLLFAPLALFLVLYFAVTAMPDYRLKKMELRMQSAVLPREIPELPPDRPATVLINMGNETQRIHGLPVSEWRRFARVLQSYNFRFRARELGTDYTKFRRLIENNPRICNVKGNEVLDLTGEGKEVFEYFALLPSDRETVRYSMIRRLTHTLTQDLQGGGVVA